MAPLSISAVAGKSLLRPFVMMSPAVLKTLLELIETFTFKNVSKHNKLLFRKTAENVVSQHSEIRHATSVLLPSLYQHLIGPGPVAKGPVSGLARTWTAGPVWVLCSRSFVKIMN